MNETIQIDSRQQEFRFENYYFHCETEWSDAECYCMHNDRCPVCRAEIEPFKSKELDTGDMILHMHWSPEVMERRQYESDDVQMPRRRL